MREWWNTPAAAWGFTLFGVGTGIVLTYISPNLGIPIGCIITLIGMLLLVRAYRKRQRTSEHQADNCSGFVYVGGKQAGGGLEVIAKIGAYNSQSVITNPEGYYIDLMVTPPDKSYRNRIIEFYVDGQKASETIKFWPGRSRSIFDLHIPNLELIIDKGDSQT